MSRQFNNVHHVQILGARVEGMQSMQANALNGNDDRVSSKEHSRSNGTSSGSLDESPEMDFFDRYGIK